MPGISQVMFFDCSFCQFFKFCLVSKFPMARMTGTSPSHPHHPNQQVFFGETSLETAKQVLPATALLEIEQCQLVN